MRESLLTIPINEVFEPRCGCPICNMRNSVEQHICEYIMGAAMMEPDVRIETNELGFCLTHYNMLLKQNNRLSLALMLNTHLAQLREDIIDKKDGAFGKGAKAKKIAGKKETCFVCSKVDWGVDHTLETLFTMFKADEGFRRLYSGQEYLCLPHYYKLITAAQTRLKKDDLKAFQEATDALAGKYAEALNADVQEFCDSFDYRNAHKLHNEDMEHVRSSIERAIEFLTSRKPSEK